MIAVFACGLLLYTWYALWSLQGKIRCQFHTKHRGIERRIISVKDKTVKFKKGTYEIHPKRFSIDSVKILGFFSVPILFAEWKWDTDQQIDPSTFKNSPDSPEALQAASSEKDWRNFNYEGSEKGTVKDSSLMKYLPFITLGAVVILGFLMYTKFNSMDFMVRSLGDMIRNIK